MSARLRTRIGLSPGVVSAIAVLASLADARTSPPTTTTGDDWLVHARPWETVVRHDDRDVVLENGLIRRTWRVSPGAACVAFDNLMTNQSLLRSVRPEARITIDGTTYDVGGLAGQPNHAFLLPEWIEQMQPLPGAMVIADWGVAELAPRLEWARVRHHAPDAAWPPKGAGVWFDFVLPSPDPVAGHETMRVRVHYEMYDGIPVLCKWISVHNETGAPVRLDAFRSEILAAVEPASHVGGDPRTFKRPNIRIETDYAFGGGMEAGAAVDHAVRWIADPLYTTQVHYQRQTPCLLDVGPELGPGIVIGPGQRHESFRTWELVHDSTDRERRGLAVRRMYRTIAPWVTENPLMMHVRWSDWDTVKSAVDQCAEVGFEMVILTFGSGFNIEDERPEYIAEMKRYADYARGQGIEIGGYSLLASRSIDAANDVVMPADRRPTFGNSPCLGSTWGQGYFRQLHRFHEQTGFTLLEHDGNYPGDDCLSSDHPGHTGHDDSRWTQWRTITDFYKWCRARGIYLNVPDWYYLSGSNKCGMGYRETNWSLPRKQQVIHTRQNIYDGTWEKTPSMGWMFVPLTQYHGGGAAATIEPLDEHRDHYERMLQSNLALGVQACFRGPRLFDSERTRSLVRHWVGWFKEHRDILESDIIHGRRADGRDVDWVLHVNPRLQRQGMLVVFNPLDEPVTRTLDVDLYYAGLTDTARVRTEGGEAIDVRLVGARMVGFEVTVPAQGMTWYVIEE